MHREIKDRKLPEDVSMLDELIRSYFEQLLNSVDENVKMGDFIKMIELRRKLTPAGSEQKKFWKMLDKIRKDAAVRRLPEMDNRRSKPQQSGVCLKRVAKKRK